jgi:hypothetical protein
MPNQPQLSPTKSNDVELPRSLQELSALGCNLRKVTLTRSHLLVAGNPFCICHSVACLIMVSDKTLAALNNPLFGAAASGAGETTGAKPQHAGIGIFFRRSAQTPHEGPFFIEACAEGVCFCIFICPATNPIALANGCSRERFCYECRISTLFRDAVS